ALAPELLVVGGDFPQPLRGHVPAPEDVLEERPDVVHAFGAAEGDDEERVVRVHATILYRLTPSADASAPPCGSPSTATSAPPAAACPGAPRGGQARLSASGSFRGVAGAAGRRM